jgi:hypothetical protein
MQFNSSLEIRIMPNSAKSFNEADAPVALKLHLTASFLVSRSGVSCTRNMMTGECS